MEENSDLFWLDDGKLHRWFRRRRKEERGSDDADPEEPAGAPTTALRGEIFVIEDKDADSVVNSDGSVDHLAAYKLFRTKFGDHYDFVFFRYDAASGVTQSGNASPTIYNQISGIGHYKGDSYDGPRKLRNLEAAINPEDVVARSGTHMPARNRPPLAGLRLPPRRRCLQRQAASGLALQLLTAGLPLRSLVR